MTKSPTDFLLGKAVENRHRLLALKEALLVVVSFCKHRSSESVLLEAARRAATF